VKRHDRRDRIEVRPNQQEGLIQELGLSSEEVARASWVVEPGGRKLEGAAGINRVLGELGGGWKVLAALYGVAPIRVVEDRYYGRVAKRRAWW
jgi:predicted DCC family thiol-disulfide oxidoreductase YuxK